MDAGKLIVSIVAGVAAGALIGALVAPDKGSETRRKMIQKGDDFARNLKKRFDEYVNKLANNLSNGKYKNEEYQEGQTANPAI